MGTSGIILVWSVLVNLILVLPVLVVWLAWLVSAERCVFAALLG